MTFLQPIVLWGLPLILLPIVIHLINRLRHRSRAWAAMRFLVAATRSSMGHNKLRQILILLLRTLAVLTLVLFLGRPLAGGWLGWALAPAPDAVLLLLDRSASMETRLPSAPISRREQAVKLLSDSAKSFEETTHLVLIESATRAPQDLHNVAHLAELPSVAPTDTAADIPAMAQAALNWMIENHAGGTEIWIASDLQRSNWLPDDARWRTVTAQLAALPQKVKVRLLAVDQRPEANRSISIKEVLRRQRGDQGQVQIVADLQRTATSPESVPLEFNLDGARAQIEVAIDGQALRWRHNAPLGAKLSGGWGSLELPADANRRDNAAFFVFGSPTPLRASVVSADAENGRFFRFAASASTNGLREAAELTTPSAAQNADWAQNTLLIWQDALPEGATAERLRAFIEEGGAVVFFPPGRAGGQRFEGSAWGEVESATNERRFRVIRWDEDQGPLARSDEGLSLPLAQTTFDRREGITGQKNVLAAFDDGAPFVTRQALGKGEFYFCASLPAKDWSNLGDGPVLVPMLQRLLLAGSRRLQTVSSAVCGELSAVDQARRWETVDSTTPKDIRTQAGVYRSGERLLAVNRPTSEDEPEILDPEEARRLFGALPVQMWQDRGAQNSQLQGEIWRAFLFALLVFLLLEGVLILPPRPRPTAGESTVPTRATPSAPAGKAA